VESQSNVRVTGLDAGDPGGPPLVSVVVPVYRQWDAVPALLAALAAQAAAVGAEIVLVDNAPGEPRPPLDLPPAARIVPCDRPGAYAARNAGAAAATGRWLAFTDADCRPGLDWLAAMARALPGKEDALLAGPVEIAPGEGPANRYATYDQIRGIPQARYVQNGYAATANLVVPAALFRSLGGFDAERFSGGDAEFCRRAGRAGYPVKLVPDAIVLHPARARWDELAAKARRVKGGQVAAGPTRRRLIWFLRTLTPPLRALWRFALAPYPAAGRLAAARVLFALWFVELDETARIFLGKSPERR
jgi:GT2 family glycosyltransferase